MPAKVVYERFLWFHTQTLRGCFPNAATLAEQFEIASKTAQRDIAFMRDRLHAPLEYAPARRGYRYWNDAYELPALWLREDEIVSLLLSARLASAVPDGALKAALRRLLAQILTHHGRPATTLEALSQKVSVKNIEYSRTDEATFHQVLDALLRPRPLRIAYFSPHNHEETTRDILPCHLLQYMGTWHLIAHCNLKNDLRDFVLSRIRSVAPSPVNVSLPVSPALVKDYLRRHFGIMTGGETFEVCLRFSPTVSPWLAEQVWHPAQEMRWEDDKTLCLSFPVADFREVKREILKHGSQVEVISPAGLREEVRQEIWKMGQIYR